MSLENPPARKRLFKIAERNISDLKRVFEEKSNGWELIGRTVFITQKGRVVARAAWDEEGRLIVNKIRRPQATKLSVGQVLYDSERQRYANIPIPTHRPELKSEGILLLRTPVYDSSTAMRHDPFWEEYEGWTLIPRTINERDGLQDFLDEYPEIAEAPHQVAAVNEADTATWKMAEQADIDAFVCGRTNTKPTLVPFRSPSQDEVIQYRPIIGQSGDFEFFSLYWVNKWIVYIPRVCRSNNGE